MDSTRRTPLILTSLGISSLLLSGCAAMRHARQIEATSNQFLELWRADEFSGMYDQLHPALQQRLPREAFIDAHEKLRIVTGRLKSYREESTIPGWQPPLINENMFQDPLPTEQSKGAVSKYHLDFERSEGHIFLELGRDSDDVKVSGFMSDLTADQLQEAMTESLQSLKEYYAGLRR